MASPDSVAVRAFVARVARRLVVRAALEGATAGLIIASLLAFVGWPTRASGVTPAVAGLIAASALVALRLLMVRPHARAAARVAEAAVPESHNLIVTTMELSAEGAPPGRSHVADDVMQIVGAHAAALVARLDPAQLFPASSRLVAGAAALAFWAATLVRVTGGAPIGPAASPTAMVDRVDIVVQPPAYTGLAARTVRNPDRVALLEGSTITAHIRSNASTISVTTADSSATQIVARSDDGSFAFDLPRAAGFISLEPRSVEGVPGPSRLIGLTITPDGAPAAHITAPGKDMVIPDGSRTLDVRIAANDDIGLSSLTLRYTKVSGAGERYTFVEGDVPIAVSRLEPTAWQARAQWNLRTLGLEPGDIVVYRAVANDARPGREPVESDAFIAEVASPGMVAVGGFALSPDDDRYALSQQMIVLKTERLLAGRVTLPVAVFADSAASIAAEQRRVRAEFVFMMGGEVEDAGADTNMTTLNETAEAAGESDLLAGREANRGRIALRRATRAMSVAARELDRAAADTALMYAREAVKSLEDAFSRDRILLRALAQREDLDPTRRLTGALTGVSRIPRASAPPTDDARVAALRDILGGIAAARRLRDARAVSHLAEQVLRFDAAPKALQDAAAALASAASDLARNEPAGADRSLGTASLIVAALLREALPMGPGVGAGLEDGAVRGAMVDLLRARRP